MTHSCSHGQWWTKAMNIGPWLPIQLLPPLFYHMALNCCYITFIHLEFRVHCRWLWIFSLNITFSKKHTKYKRGQWFWRKYVIIKKYLIKDILSSGIFRFRKHGSLFRLIWILSCRKTKGWTVWHSGGLCELQWFCDSLSKIWLGWHCQESKSLI